MKDAILYFSIIIPVDVVVQLRDDEVGESDESQKEDDEADQRTDWTRRLEDEPIEEIRHREVATQTIRDNSRLRLRQ